MMEEYVNKAYRKAIVWYYLIYAKVIVLALIGYWLNQSLVIKLSKSVVTGISTLTMLYLMASIFGAFYFYNKKMQQIPAIKDLDLRFAVYVKWLRLRLFLVGANFVLNVALYYLLHDKSFLYAAAIGAVAMVFCKPNKVNIDKELNPITKLED